MLLYIDYNEMDGSLDSIHKRLKISLPKFENEIVGLVLDISKKPKNIDDIDKINGYAYFYYEQEIAEIENISLSKQSLKKMVKNLSLFLPYTTTIWIIAENKQNAMDLAQIGFSHPKFIKKSPLGTDFKTYKLALRKLNQYQKKNINTVQKSIQYLISQKNACRTFIRFDTHSLKYFKGYLSSLTSNRDGSVSQKEIGGILSSDKIQKVGNRLVFVLSINSINIGEEEAVNIEERQYTFHTHPHEAYTRHNTEVGWPSISDYIGSMEIFLDSGIPIHFVISKEGIYIISIGKYWIMKQERLKNIGISVLSDFIEERYIDSKCGQKSKDSIHKYLKTINNDSMLNFRGHKLFEVRLINWTKLEKGEIIEIFHPIDDRNCVPP